MIISLCNLHWIDCPLQLWQCVCVLSVKLESSQTAVSVSYLTKFSDQLTSRCKQLVRIRFMVFTRFLACASILPSCLLTWRCEVCRQWCGVWCAKWMKDGGWRSQVDTKMNNRLEEECFDIPGLAQTRQIQLDIYFHEWILLLLKLLIISGRYKWCTVWFNLIKFSTWKLFKHNLSSVLRVEISGFWSFKNNFVCTQPA